MNDHMTSEREPEQYPFAVGVLEGAIRNALIDLKYHRYHEVERTLRGALNEVRELIESRRPVSTPEQVDRLKGFIETVHRGTVPVSENVEGLTVVSRELKDEIDTDDLRAMAGLPDTTAEKRGER